jgi:antitoxin component YwqK of YwqJK toxin-antitoxin module
MDRYVKTIDSLYIHNKLSVKEYPGRTFVGSLNGYYHNGTLVYVNTLMDGEYGGIETKYYVKDTVLYKVLQMSAGFKEPNEWKAYYAKHKKNKQCNVCHNTKDCIITTLIYNKSNTLVSVSKGKKLKLSPAEQAAGFNKTFNTFLALKDLLSKI